MKTPRKTLPFFQKLHDKSPAIAQKVSFAVGAGSIAANSFGLSVPLYVAGLAKIFGKSKMADDAIISMADYWIRSNNFMIDKVLPTKDWRINMPDDLKPDGKYLLICNHQSWVDTSVIQYVSEGILPITRFFTKHELIYIPVVGQTFYFLDFPMMKRHSKEAIAKNPELKGQDLAVAKKACQMLAKKPFVLLNYLEGTRFSPQKHAAQNSSYEHLLKPKAGGFALAIASLGDKIDGILDMTIVYPDGTPSYDGLWRGELRRLSVDICKRSMPHELFEALKQGAYHDSTHPKHSHAKQALHDWLHHIWQQKDQKIAHLKAAAHP